MENLKIIVDRVVIFSPSAIAIMCFVQHVQEKLVCCTQCAINVRLIKKYEFVGWINEINHMVLAFSNIPISWK